jgi:hypothetical protein
VSEGVATNCSPQLTLNAGSRRDMSPTHWGGEKLTAEAFFFANGRLQTRHADLRSLLTCFLAWPPAPGKKRRCPWRKKPDCCAVIGACRVGHPPLDFLRARKAENASGIAAIAGRRRRGRRGPSVVRLIVAPRWRGIVERYAAPRRCRISSPSGRRSSTVRSTR